MSAVIFYFAPFVSTGMVVTGNYRLTAFMASVISGFLLTIASASVQPVFAKFNIKLKDDWQLVMANLFVNVLVIWIIARYADLTGIGINNAWVAVALGILISLGEWLIWKFSLKK